MAILRGNDFVAHEVEADQFGAGIAIEMAPYNITNTFTKGGNGIGLGMDRDSHGPRGVTPFGRVLDDKNDFSHTCILSEES